MTATETYFYIVEVVCAWRAAACAQEMAINDDRKERKSNDK